jgi:hypothetical protein
MAGFLAHAVSHGLNSKLERTTLRAVERKCSMINYHESPFSIFVLFYKSRMRLFAPDLFCASMIAGIDLRNGFASLRIPARLGNIPTPLLRHILPALKTLIYSIQDNQPCEGEAVATE